MNKEQIVSAMSAETGDPLSVSRSVLNAFMNATTKALKKGESVKLHEFGAFSIRKRKARIARNLQTGKPIKVSAKRVVKFKASKILLKAVQ